MNSTDDDSEKSDSGSDFESLDDEQNFIYDEEMQKLICVGSDYETIPPGIIDQYARQTKILDFSGNQFRRFSSLEKFVDLEELILDGNQIDDHFDEFPRLTKLHSLMLNKNHFEDLLKLINNLRRSCPQLTHLSLLGNRLCPDGLISIHFDDDYRRYRHLLISRLPTLKFLDAQMISSQERHLAMQLGDLLYSIAEMKRRQFHAS